MLVICEDCAKKYDIDATKIKGEKAQFACKECGHIIVVEKPVDDAPVNESAEADTSMESVSPAATSVAATAGVQSAGRSAGKGTSVGVYIFLTMLTGFALICAAVAYLYLTFIPGIINHQIDLRTSAVSTALTGAVKKPLILRNYLQVNKEAKNMLKIPGVAYTAIVNPKGIILAGYINKSNKFDTQFVQAVNKGGFPRDILEQNTISGSGESKNARFTVGGQAIVDRVSSIGDTGSTVHVGVFVSEVDEAIRNALMSPVTLSLLAGLLFVCLLMIMLLSKLIGKPLRELTDIANRISFGQLDLEITPKGPREMRELAHAFDRMRVSIKTALERLRR